MNHNTPIWCLKDHNQHKIDCNLIQLRSIVESVSVNVSGSLFHFKNEREALLLLGSLSWSWDVRGDIGAEWFWREFDAPISGDDILSSPVAGEPLCCWGTSESKASCSVMNNPFDLQLVSGSLGKAGSALVVDFWGTSGVSANPRTPEIVDNECCNVCNWSRKAAHNGRNESTHYKTTKHSVLDHEVIVLLLSPRKPMWLKRRHKDAWKIQR